MSTGNNTSTVLCTGLDHTGRQIGSVEDFRNVRGTYPLEITQGGGTSYLEQQKRGEGQGLSGTYLDPPLLYKCKVEMLFNSL